MDSQKQETTYPKLSGAVYSPEKPFVTEKQSAFDLRYG
jgi:hypothetical protein